MDKQNWFRLKENVKKKFIWFEINLSLTVSYFFLSDAALTDNQPCVFYFEHQVFLTQSVRQNGVESVQIGGFLVCIFPVLDRM